MSVQSTESLTSLSSKVINTTATPPPVDDLLEISSDLADYRLDDGEVDTNQPCYMGICLPRNILNLFPRRCPNKPYVGIDLEAQGTTVPNTAITTHSGGVAVSPVVVENVDETDHLVAAQSQESATTTMQLCLNCSRTTQTTSTANKTRSSSSKSNGNPVIINSAELDGRGSLSQHHKKLIMLRNVTDSKRMKGSCSWNSGGGGDSDSESEEEHALMAILVNVQRCANPVLMKQAKMNLLELKQKHGEYFQDLCLYSEVLKAIGRNTYRQTSRRFLQELFLDIDFEVLLRDLMLSLNVAERQATEECGSGWGGTDRDTTSYGSMIHNAVELRNGSGRKGGRECGKIEEEDQQHKQSGEKDAGVRKSLPEPILSPTRSVASGDSSEPNGGVTTANKGFARVQLSCSVNKFPVKRDRANSLNVPSTTLKDY